MAMRVPSCSLPRYHVCCRVTGSGTGSTVAAGQQLQVAAAFQDAYFNAVTDAAQLQGQNLSLAYTGLISGGVPMVVQQGGDLRYGQDLYCLLELSDLSMFSLVRDSAATS